MAARIRSLKATEDEIQGQVVQGLRLLGYVVLVTSRRPKRCSHCGKWGRSGAGDGVSRGLPDLLVWKPGWPGWLGLETKSADGRVRPEQRELVDRGCPVIIIRSWDDALAAVRGHEVKLSRMA